MSDHKVELIDATISLIKTAIDKFANNPTTDKARKNMFLIERIPASGAVKSIKLIGNMSTGAIKQLTVDVDCENNLMLCSCPTTLSNTRSRSSPWRPGASR